MVTEGGGVDQNMVQEGGYLCSAFRRRRVAVPSTGTPHPNTHVPSHGLVSRCLRCDTLRLSGNLVVYQVARRDRSLDV